MHEELVLAFQLVILSLKCLQQFNYVTTTYTAYKT